MQSADASLSVPSSGFLLGINTSDGFSERSETENDLQRIWAEYTDRRVFL